MKKLFICFMMLAGTMLLQAQVQRTTAQRPATQAAAAKTFTLTNGKLGPVQTGVKFANIPATYAGLYDKYTRKVETMADEDGEWTTEYYQFTKAGKKVFRVNLDDSKKISSITLQEGSAAIVKTPEGYHVGYLARTLFAKKRMQWENYYTGTVFASSGHYSFEVNSDDLLNTDIPTKAGDFKPTAKICSITYVHTVESY